MKLHNFFFFHHVHDRRRLFRGRQTFHVRNEAP
jgi:hypothetical protein